MSKRKIAIITGSRAEYGLLYRIIKKIHDDADLELQLIVTGMHLDPQFGSTVREIEKDSFPIAERVKIPLSSDRDVAIATSMGLGMIGFAKAYARLKPNIIVVLGDRFEIHAAVSAALSFRIPIAHIHSGESTEGAIDEQFRHSITKMSHIHFASAEQYRKRIIQMGERPENVFCVGAPGIDNILKLNLFDRDRLGKELNIPKNKKIGIVTYHPVTLEFDTSQKQISDLLQAIRKTKGIYWVFTQSNADAGGRVINKRIKDFVKGHPGNTKFYPSLGQKRYLSLLKNASVMVGNSSSGIIEAPTFKLPVVNIGDRQKGRIRAANIIDVRECKKRPIVKAINKAISPEFSKSLKGLKNPYEKGDASQKIVNRLKTFPITEELIKKKFYEISQQ